MTDRGSPDTEEDELEDEGVERPPSEDEGVFVSSVMGKAVSDDDRRTIWNGSLKRKTKKFVALTESPMKIGGLLKNDSIKLEYRYRN
jgi:hypothetical protein